MFYAGKDNKYVAAAVVAFSSISLAAGIVISMKDFGTGYAIATSSAIPVLAYFDKENMGFRY